MQRIDSLDYLRGFMALAVMIFHYTAWSGTEIVSSSLLGKLGIYAVSIFYLLSGLSLSLVYINRSEIFSVQEFLIKRFFRLAPLFWMVLTVALIFKYARAAFLGDGLFEVDIVEVILNYTLIFGFFMPDKYFSIGAWSIGNEVVFYALFPLIILLYSKFKRIGLIFAFLLSLFLYIYYAFYVLSEEATLVDQWGDYVNPLNQIFLFVVGCCIGVNHGNKESTKWKYGLICFIVCLFLFAIYPVKSGDISLVVGVDRIILTIFSSILVLLALNTRVNFTGWLSKLLKFFGDSCYSIYLIPPLVAFPVVFILNGFFGFNLLISYTASALITFVAAFLSYKYIEKPMMSFGKRISKKKFLSDL